MLFRLMNATDLATCLARWPLPDVPLDLARAVLTTALHEQRLRGAVFRHPALGELVGFGLSVFVRGADLLGLVEQEHPLVATHLHAEAAAMRVYLDPREAVLAQREDDMHMVVIVVIPDSLNPQDPQAQELFHAAGVSFRLMHEGYALQGIWQEGFPENAGWLQAAGYQVWHRKLGSEERPRWLFGIRRNPGKADWPSYPVDHVLHRRTRRLGLSTAQCRVAELALWNLDDDEVACLLAIAPATVRRHWRAIFDRIDANEAIRIETVDTAAAEGRRGPERRRKVLNYLQSHLQEIRPA